LSEKTKPKDIYLSVQNPKALAATDLEILGDEVPEGKVVSIETFFVIDQTTANKTMKIGFRRGGTDYYVKRQAAGASIYGVTMDRPLILVEGERPIAIVESPTINDVCLMVARGPYLNK